MTAKDGKTTFCTVVVKVYRSSAEPGSRRESVAFEKSIAKGLSVEAMVKLGPEAAMIQLKVASELVEFSEYVTDGSHFQLALFEVQAVFTVSRKVVKV